LPYKQYPIAPRSTLNTINAETCRKNVGEAYEKQNLEFDITHTRSYCMFPNLNPTHLSFAHFTSLPASNSHRRSARSGLLRPTRAASITLCPLASLSGPARKRGCSLRLLERLRGSSLPLGFLPGGGFSLFVGWRRHFLRLVVRPGRSNLPFGFS